MLRAYYHFLSTPEQFAEYYANPKNAPIEYDALDLFAQYSTLHAGSGDQLILGHIASVYGENAAANLMGAQLHNLEQSASITDDTIHVVQATRWRH